MSDADRGRLPKQHHRRILKAAERLFADRGYEGTSARAIVAKARDNQAAALEKRRAHDHDAFILVVWEHKQIAPMVRALLSAHGADAADVKLVEDWDTTDFDSIYVVAIAQLRNGTRATFAHKHEGLDGQSNTCPH